MLTLEKATRKHTKNHNQRLILRTIYEQRQISRADIARSTGLTRTTVSSVVTTLIDEGLVEEGGQGLSAGGKPPTLLQFVNDSRHIIGLDLANREFQGGVFDLRGNLIHRESVAADDQKGEAALALVYELIDHLTQKTSRPLLGIGIGTPGVIDIQLGVIRTALNLGWSDLPLKQLLEDRYNTPVHIANDSQMAALAEYTFNEMQETPNLIVIKAGRGISAGIILNGQLYQGANAGASEVGHIRVVDAGEPCVCGLIGCLETVASSHTLVRQAKAFAQRDPNSTLHQFATSPDAITTDTILAAFQAGDEAMQQIIRRAGHYLGVTVANLIGALNMQHIIIGGSLSRFGNALLLPIRQEVKARVLPLIANETQIELSSLGQDSVILGATALLLSQELEVV